MDPVGVPFDQPIIQRMKPLNGILQIPAYYADTDTIFRGRLYWFPLIHRRQPIMELASTPALRCYRARLKATEKTLTEEQFTSEQSGYQ